jgi:hypothetical protein
MNRRRKFVVVATIICALIFAIVRLIPQDGDTLKFNAVDLWTGKLLTTGSVQITYPWFRSDWNPLAKLGIDPQHSRTIPITSNIVEIHRIPRRERSAYILVNVPGYEEAFIRQHLSWVITNSNYYMVGHAVGSNYLTRTSPYQYVKKDKTFTVALEPTKPNPAITPLPDPDPPVGTKEKAITAVNRYQMDHSGKASVPDEVRYVNGYWEVEYYPKSLRIGSGGCYHVSVDGDVLNYIGSE